MTEQSEITNDDKMLAAVGYPIPLVALIMLFIEEKKNRPFIKYHAVQALALSVVLGIALFILAWIPIVNCITPVVWLITLWPAIETYNGKYIELPVITDFIKKQGWVK